MNKKNGKNTVNFILPLVTTFVLLALVIIYTSRLFYRISVSGTYEAGKDKIQGVTAILENYIDTAEGILWVTADTVDYMVKEDFPNEDIADYLVKETQNQKFQFDENYTGLYGVIKGEYLDGLEWVPPEDYDPTQRDWYKIAKREGGKLVLVPPYVDAQTGSVVITVVKLLSDGNNTVALDVATNQIQKIVEETDVNGKGYGFIVDGSGTIIAHRNRDMNGKNLNDFPGGSELMSKLDDENPDGYFEMVLDGKKSTVFVDSLMGQWNVIIVVGNDELFRETYTQLAINGFIYTIVFALIVAFYIIAYSNEQRSSRESEALKIREHQKAYEAELLKLEKAAADSANKAKGDFLAQMSHEIRTPINAMLGMNEMILRESDDENILDYSQNIQSAGKTLLFLINSILDFSKIEGGKMEIVPTVYDTSSLINNLVNSVLERAKAKGLELRVNASPELPSKLIGDDVRITQVVMNLLTNAVKYTDKGTVTLDIQVKEKNYNDCVLAVAVKDTGIGIRNEDIDKLFESFSRLEESRNRYIEGTGLGMMIVTKLLDMMDSKLDVKSEYGEGSEFSFEIKQGINDPKPIGNMIERRVNTIGRKKHVNHSFPNARVLVTDDNDMNLKVAGNLLKLFGIKADLAPSGLKTIEMMKNNKYDIVFLDHMMPGMDGIETLGKLNKAGLVGSDTVIIALTANAVIGAKEMYLNAGFTDYLSKPIEIDALEKKLCQYLNEEEEIKGENASAVDNAKNITKIMDSMDEEVLEFAPVNKESDSDEKNTTDASTDDKGEVDLFNSNGVKFDNPSEVIEKVNALGISTEAGLQYCVGDENFYLEMLCDYTNSLSSRLKELNDDLNSGSINDYQTKVHALKSTSKTVGVNDISELAKELEFAAKNNNVDFIKDNNSRLKDLTEDKEKKLKKALGI